MAPRRISEEAAGSRRDDRNDATRIARVAIIAMCGALAFGWRGPVDAWQQADGTCRISGHALSGSAPLPGVSVLVKSAGAVKTASSTDPDGTYRVALPFGTYDVTAELTGFSPVSRSITVAGAPCDQTVDFQLSLAPRVPLAAAAPATPADAAGRGASPSSAPPAGRGAAPQQPGGGAAQAANGGRGQRFETLNVQTQEAATAGVETNDATDAAARLLLPPGFSTEGPTEAVAINGNMANLDRGMMADRLDAIGRGEFNPATGEFGQGFGPGGRGFDGQGGGGRGGFGGPGGGPGGRGAGGPGGPGGGRGDFVLGGRGRGQNALQRAVELLLRRLGARQRAVPSCILVPRRNRDRIRDRDSASRLAVRFGFPASIKVTVAPTSMRATPGTAAATSSISTPRCRPRRCVPVISRRCRAR